MFIVVNGKIMIVIFVVWGLEKSEEGKIIYLVFFVVMIFVRKSREGLFAFLRD